MQNFIKIGEILKAARLKQSLGLEEISEKLKIRKEYLLSMENGTISNQIPGVYYLGYIKNYSLLLGINHQELLELARADNFVTEMEKALPKVEVKQSKAEFAIEPSKKLIAACMVGIVVFIFLLSGSFKSEETVKKESLYSQEFSKQIGASSILELDAKKLKTSEELVKVSSVLEGKRFEGKD